MATPLLLIEKTLTGVNGGQWSQRQDGERTDGINCGCGNSILILKPSQATYKALPQRLIREL